MKLTDITPGYAVALAWPQTFCKQPGSWYDPLMFRLGINQNNYYKVGHAALLLIDAGSGQSHYFDFGRYHAPYQFGRVRSALTDKDLAVKNIANINPQTGTIENLQQILQELQQNPACHGEGELHAAWCRINFTKAYAKATLMQQNSPMPYGPFQVGGSNCSRFVNRVIHKGALSLKTKLQLNFWVPLTPTPLSNVSALSHPVIVPAKLKTIPFFPGEPLTEQKLYSTLPEPTKAQGIPQNALWLAGEGAGSWFVLSYRDEAIHFVRYSPEGRAECSGYFVNNGAISRNGLMEATISYPSHCNALTLLINDTKITLKPLTESVSQKGKREDVAA